MQNLLLRESCPERSDRARKARLMQSNHIHITFTENNIRFAFAPRIVEPVEIFTLVKQFCLR